MRLVSVTRCFYEITFKSRQSGGVQKEIRLFSEVSFSSISPGESRGEADCLRLSSRNLTVYASRSFRQENPEDANVLAFWMANASELLHFFKKDDQISPYCAASLDVLAGVVQLAFRSLVSVLQADLDTCMAAFLDEANPDDDNDEEMGEFIGREFLGRDASVGKAGLPWASGFSELWRRL